MVPQPRLSSSRIRWVPVICSAALWCAFPASAAAKPSTLDGMCKLNGRVTFAQPVGLTPRPDRYSDRSSGTCTGTIDGVYRQDTPVRFRAQGSGSIGCATARTRSAGVLIFSAAGVRIHVRTRGVSAGTEILATFSGRVSGTGVAEITLKGDQASTAACVAGTLESIGYQLIGRTITPVVG